MKIPAYNMTNESITVISEGKTYTIRRGSPNYLGLRSAILAENWDAVTGHLTVPKSIASWAKGKFKVIGEIVHFDSEPLPAELNDRILEMVAKNEDPSPLFKFWERLQKNPSMRSVQQLWSFLNHQGIPLTKDGTFLAYKGVKENYLDQHSGTFDNSPGKVHEMPRNKISDDPNEPCHEGFHVGALEYARTFSSRVVVCEVAPEDVVCVPYDASAQKMRVSKYRVVGNHGGELLSNTTHQEELPVDAPALPKKFVKFEGMDLKALLSETMDDLRQYASKGLKIVGAYKLPGGKLALAKAILKNRK